jgi:hypothetical protein
MFFAAFCRSTWDQEKADLSVTNKNITKDFQPFTSKICQGRNCVKTQLDSELNLMPPQDIEASGIAILKFVCGVWDTAFLAHINQVFRRADTMRMPAIASDIDVDRVRT